MTAADSLSAGNTALRTGQWEVARAEFVAALDGPDEAEARFGLAVAMWWLDDNTASVGECTRAYQLFRIAGDVEAAVRCAVWLAITYKANFGNEAAGNGWVGRADRLLEPLEVGPLHGWAWVARAYRLPDLDEAERLTAAAYAASRDAGDIDLELVALAQLGLIRVGKGETAAGFALLDEAMAATLAGESASLDTVVYTCCDMMKACELTGDLERAVQWCQVADGFVASYGCPFLYAECRIAYGTVLIARGRWAEAERELRAGLHLTAGTCPALHARATARLAALRVRQGRLEEAGDLLSGADPGIADADHSLSLAALLLARGDGAGAGRQLERRLDRVEEHLGAALDLVVESRLAEGDLTEASAAIQKLVALSERGDAAWLVATAAGARGRLASALGEHEAAREWFDRALTIWSRLDLPFESARARFDSALLLVGSDREAAVEHARRALDVLETLGASLEADRVAAFLRAEGVQARTGAKGLGLLTEREQEVVRLVGAGLSNPEIAERLHVSRKTAAHHVSHILTKLHLRNRAEVAAFVSRHA